MLLSIVRFQVGELRKHQLLETRVRCYALRHERIAPPPTAGDPEAGGCVGTSPEDLAAKLPDQVDAMFVYLIIGGIFLAGRFASRGVFRKLKSMVKTRPGGGGGF